jgi:hypothetical protein
MFYIKNENGENTFTTFSVDLPKLKNGYYMFGRSLAPFEVVGDDEFKYTAIEKFEGNLSNLIDARWMFNKSSIKYFLPTSNLSKLKCGYNMFHHAYLKPESYKKLSEILPNIASLTKTEKLNIESNWTYTVNGETKTIPLEMRGRLGLQCRRLE